MANPGLTKAYIADTDIGPHLIVKVGAADGSAALATTNIDKLLGITEGVGTAAGQNADVIHEGIADALAGGTIADGDWITCDSASRAISASPGAGVSVQVVGKAMESAVAGDIFRVLLNLVQIQG